MLGKIKLLGAMLCLAGALTITLYKGKVFYISHHHKYQNSSNDHEHKLRGTIFLMCSCMSYGCWFLIQVNLYYGVLFYSKSMYIRRVFYDVKLCYSPRCPKCSRTNILQRLLYPSSQLSKARLLDYLLIEERPLGSWDSICS